jgi:hypothetical protein
VSFRANFDANGWSIFRGDYKYNEECKVLFMTSNLIAGFIQRTEEIRKWLFGTLTIRGVAGKSECVIVLVVAYVSSSFSSRVFLLFLYLPLSCSSLFHSRFPRSYTLLSSLFVLSFQR